MTLQAVRPAGKPNLRMREVMKGRQASERSPLKTAAGLMTQQRTGPNPWGAVPSLSRAATTAATPPEVVMEHCFNEHASGFSH